MTTRDDAPCRTLIEADFETHPIADGWLGVGCPPVPFDGEWKKGDAHSGERCLFASLGGWESPSFPVEPFKLYRIRFRSRCASQALWVVRSFEDGGRELISDHYSNIDASQDWAANEFFFVGRAGSAWARLGFRVDENPIHIDEVRVEESTREEALRWHDSVYAQLPPVDYTPSPGRWERLSGIRAKLNDGQTLRMVLLGDSIVNDVANSLFHVLIERHYPQSRVQLVHSVGGSKGCWYFKEENRVRTEVLDHRPDLVVIGGSSHNRDAESVREVIHQIRAETEADILLMTGAFLELGWTPKARELGHIPPEEGAKAEAENAAFRRHLRQIAAEEDVALLDLRELWDAYIVSSRQPLAWYKRDAIHANTRGKQIAGRIIERFFCAE